MRRLLVPFALVTLSTGCFEFEWEEAHATLDWDRDLSAVHVDVQVMNLGLWPFECEDVATCLAGIQHGLAPRPAVEDPHEFLWTHPAETLAQYGATDVAIALERDGERVDLHLTFTVPPASKALPFLQIYVVDHQAGERSRPRVLVGLRERDTVEPLRGERFAYSDPLSTIGEVNRFVLLPSGVRSVRVTRHAFDEVVPMLEAMPGLEEALETAGLLEREGTPIAVR